ncbi:MAG: aminotransferase [Alphaproteobacteria bacterium]
MSHRINPLVGAVAVPPIAEAKAWIAGRTFPADKPLIDLAQGEPSYPPPPELSDHLAGMLGRPEMARYTAIEGLPTLRAALATDMRAVYGGVVAADQLCITAGCNQAFCLALMALARAGDEVIVPAPYYFNHQMWLDMLGLRAVHLPLRAAEGGVPNVGDAAARITRHTRAIVLVTPNNPTGAVYPPEVIDAFFELARQHDVALVIDETYRDFLAGDAPPHGLFRRADWPGTLVHLYSFSKVYALTGYRVGAVACGSDLLGEIAKAMDCVAICAPRIGQEAALYGLERLGPWRREMRALMRGRAVALREAFRHNDLAYELVSVGGFFAYLRHPFPGAAGAEVARRLAEEQNLLCLPGSMFGAGQEPYLRLAFANVDAELMPEIARRLATSQG